MTLDKRRILNAARHASIYQPALMKSKTLDYLEIFILQSCCRLQELYDNLSKFIVDQPLSEEDLQMYMAVQQDLAQAQADITTLTLVKEHLSRVTGSFEKACTQISNETIAEYLKEAKYEQDPSADFRAQLERTLSHNIEPPESHE